MTVRFIKSWNGYYEGQVVTSPSGRSEVDLVTLGYAVTDLDGPDNGSLPVMASKTLTGGIELTAGGVSSTPSLCYGSGLPFVMPSSGSVGNTAGRVQVTTGFDYIIGPSYVFFPVGALFVASAAGWYYTVWESATVGTVYANTYFSGTPSIPAQLTPLVTVAGAYTQAIGTDVMGPVYVVPANYLLANGSIEWGRVVNNNGSAGQKLYNTYFGATVFQGLSQTTNPKEAGQGAIVNRGRQTAQVAANGAHGDSNNASSIVKLNVDTSNPQLFAMSLQITVATDYAMIESHRVRFNQVG